ncbi:MAPEG family protein [Aquisalimonas lutea]|uniref:MAPEG family protein n=1 Tax=Aquisalimonas lutea TaxID=1327750 RepID=UPI0025B5E85A|nr:MAPEG family protein [Aquisalimonas lutea]MDN3519388.1 MAPEG family protein [Aquisalimonas lutea]
MSIPLFVLLAFAGWTLLSMVLTVGVYRWHRILSGRNRIGEFSEYRIEGRDWYKRALRAHANCVENLPVYGAVVVAIAVTGVSDPLLDGLALVFLIARIAQTSVHVGLQHSDLAATVRFSLFFVQLVCMTWMGLYVVFEVV